MPSLNADRYYMGIFNRKIDLTADKMDHVIRLPFRQVTVVPLREDEEAGGIGAIDTGLNATI